MPSEKETEPILKGQQTTYYGKMTYLDGLSNSQNSDVHVSIGALDTDVTYSWHNIDVFAGGENGGRGICLRRKNKVAEEKHILKDVSGVVRPGEVLAIMGASGAGKTTLLNVLTYRNLARLRVSGRRGLNGDRASFKKIRTLSAYVQQDDMFIGTLTVREHLIFQALVRMDQSLNYDRRMQRVEEVISDLGLNKCCNTLIGTPERGIKGISGGERKRLSFASEVLTDPPLMLCDEPTSGLDSFMAQNVVSVLKNLAERGKTIICTIHQPSSEVYAMFDRILLMAEGRVAYMGDVDGAIAFFRETGYTCPPNYNPADFFIHTLAIIPDEEQACWTRVKAIADSFEASNLGAGIRQEAEANISGKTNESDDVDVVDGDKSPYRTNWWGQFKAVFWRSWISLVRQRIILRVRTFQTIMVAVLLGIIYLDQELDENGVMNINGALFLFLTNITFQNALGVVNVFCTELPLFLREHCNGMYRSDVYFLSKTLADFPLFVLYAVLFCGIAYYMIGLNPDIDRFFTAMGIIVLVSNVGCSFGYMISCISGTINIALAISAPLIIPFMLFGGFFLNNGSVPVWLNWLNYLSWFKYGNEALCINQWNDVTGIKCSRNTSCANTGAMVLETLSFDPDNLTLDIGLLAALAFGYRVIAYIALLIRTYQKS